MLRLITTLDPSPGKNVSRAAPVRYWMPVLAFCATQIVSWGTLYYAFSVLLSSIAFARGWKQAEMVGAFSSGLLVSGLAAYPTGRWIHQFGGRPVMACGSVIAAVALVGAAAASSLPAFYAAWILAGLAMAMTLYEAAFAVLAAAYDVDYRRAVTMVTLAGGFASTLFWPLTERLVVWFGWQAALLCYAGLHVFFCLPLHLLCLRRGPARNNSAETPNATSAARTLRALIREPRFLCITGSFTANSVVFSVIAVHLIPLLQSKGATMQQAAWLAAAAGPMQVLGRIMEFTFGGRWKASQTGTFALSALFPALLGLSLSNPPWIILFLSIGLYGISNGIMTIVRSLNIVELYGRNQYAQISGAISAPGTISRAIGPVLASLLLLNNAGGYSAVLMLLAAMAILALFLFRRANQTKASCRG
jgi:predicted MFS family arabinose efflux permease